MLQAVLPVTLEAQEPGTLALLRRMLLQLSCRLARRSIRLSLSSDPANHFRQLRSFSRASQAYCRHPGDSLQACPRADSGTGLLRRDDLSELPRPFQIPSLQWLWRIAVRPASLYLAEAHSWGPARSGFLTGFDRLSAKAVALRPTRPIPQPRPVPGPASACARPADSGAWSRSGARLRPVLPDVRPLFRPEPLRQLPRARPKFFCNAHRSRSDLPTAQFRPAGATFRGTPQSIRRRDNPRRRADRVDPEHRPSAARALLLDGDRVIRLSSVSPLPLFLT